MARLFLTQREFDLISSITKEFLKDMMGQAVYYYPVNINKSDKNSLYGESQEKIFDRPIYLEAAIEYKGDSNFTQDASGLDKKSQITVYLHRTDMDDRGIYPKMGDFIQLGGVLYEVKKLTDPKLIYGNIDFKLHYVLECEQARRGNFNVPFVEPALDLQSGVKDGYFTQLRGEPESDIREIYTKTGRPITGAKSSPFDGSGDD